MKNLGLWAILLAVGLAIGGIFQYNGVRNELRAAQTRAGLVTDSLVAARDTTRLVAELRHDVMVYEHRVVQSKLAVDSLDRLLKQASKSRANMAVAVAAYQDTMKSTVREDSASVRYAEFRTYSRPYSIYAEVAIPQPAPDAVSQMELQIQLDTARMGVRLSCALDKNGLNYAKFQVVVEDWLNVRVDGVQQDPNICNPQILVPKSRISKPVLAVTASVVGLVLGVLLAK